MKKMIFPLMLSLAFGCQTLLAAVQVSNVSARQRWPWNNLVDVEFTVSGAAEGEAFAVELSATGGGRTVGACSLQSEPVVGVGVNRLVWDFGRDCPDFKAEDMQVSVSLFPFSDATPVYLVIDISGGETASSYPVRYTTSAPVHTVGAEDPCKTTEIWLKRVKAGSIAMGADGKDFAYATHTGTLTEDYYLGVFALTQAQYELVAKSSMNKPHSFFINDVCRATRPVDAIPYGQFRDEQYAWPKTKEILPTADTFLARLQRKTGLKIDLPTEWQWEYACRAGTTTPRYTSKSDYRSIQTGGVPTGVAVKDADSQWTTDHGTTYVDAFDPNPWGFYGMLGNVWEWCVNLAATVSKGDVLTNPEGRVPTGVNSDRARAVRGGSWTTENSYCCSYGRGNCDSWNVTANEAKYSQYGARLCLTLKKE